MILHSPIAEEPSDYYGSDSARSPSLTSSAFAPEIHQNGLTNGNGEPVRQMEAGAPEGEEEDEEDITPVHPLPSMQAPFEESMTDIPNQQNLSSFRLPQPDRFKDQAQQRWQLQAPTEEGFNISYNAKWRALPGAKHHPIDKIFAQIIFGIHLLVQGMEKSVPEVTSILQDFVVEFDRFQQRVDEDLEIARDDLTTLFGHMSLPLQHVNVFDTLLNDPSFRQQTIEGNKRIERLVMRCNQLMHDYRIDLKRFKECNIEFNLYLFRIGNDWTQDRKDLNSINRAMRIDATQWDKNVIALIKKLKIVFEDLRRVTDCLVEFDKRCAAANRRALSSRSSSRVSARSQPSQSTVPSIPTAPVPKIRPQYLLDKPLPKVPDNADIWEDDPIPGDNTRTPLAVQPTQRPPKAVNGAYNRPSSRGANHDKSGNRPIFSRFSVHRGDSDENSERSTLWSRGAEIIRRPSSRQSFSRSSSRVGFSRPGSRSTNERPGSRNGTMRSFSRQGHERSSSMRSNNLESPSSKHSYPAPWSRQNSDRPSSRHTSDRGSPHRVHESSSSRQPSEQSTLRRMVDRPSSRQDHDRPDSRQGTYRSVAGFNVPRPWSRQTNERPMSPNSLARKGSITERLRTLFNHPTMEAGPVQPLERSASRLSSKRPHNATQDSIPEENNVLGDNIQEENVPEQVIPEEKIVHDPPPADTEEEPKKKKHDSVEALPKPPPTRIIAQEPKRHGLLGRVWIKKAPSAIELRRKPFETADMPVIASPRSASTGRLSFRNFFPRR